MLELKILIYCVVLLGILISEVFVDKNFTDFKFYQTDYKVKFERIELVNFNKQYMKFYKITTYKYNRTTPLVNRTFEFNINVGYDLEVILQAYVFLSNEYRYFPMRFQVNYCYGVAKNYAGIGEYSKCGNMTGCPLKKGVIYHLCNWSPNTAQLPPFIPNGRYMLEIQSLYNGTNLFLQRVYAEIYRPIFIP